MNHALTVILDALINGLMTGLVSLAFTVVYLPTRIFYLALGGIITIAPFCALVGLQHGGSPWLANGIALVIAVLLSLGCEFFNHAPLIGKQATSGVHLMTSLGIYIVLSQSAALVWGNETQVFWQGAAAVVTLAGVTLSESQIISLGVAIASLTLFYSWLNASQLGLQFRALSDNPDAFALRGYNPQTFRRIAFAISGGLGAIAALLMAADVGFDAHSGLQLVVLGIVGAIIGGRQSFWGPLLGSVLLELIRAASVWFLSAQWETMVTFTVLALFLVVRPNGWLDSAHRLETRP